MIFISESGLLDRSRKTEWDAWYVDHLQIMRTVDGISSAQRFETDTPGFPPSLAMYTVASAEVFKDPYYLSIRGFGSWKPHIDPAQYRRTYTADWTRLHRFRPARYSSLLTAMSRIPGSVRTSPG